MVSSLLGYLIESSLQKKPRWKGLCRTVSITNGSPASREAMREKTRGEKKQTGYKIMSPLDPYPKCNTVCLCKAGDGSHVRGSHHTLHPLKGSGSILRNIKVQILMFKMLAWQ